MAAIIWGVAVGIQHALLHRRAEDADAQRLAEDQHVAILGVAVALDHVRVGEAQGHQAVIGSGESMLWPPATGMPASAHTLAPPQDAADGRQRQLCPPACRRWPAP